MDEVEIVYVFSVLGYDKFVERIFIYNCIEDMVFGGKIFIDEMNLEFFQIYMIYYIMYIVYVNNLLSEVEFRQSFEFVIIFVVLRVFFGDIVFLDQISVGMNVFYNECGEYVKFCFEEVKRRLRMKEYKFVWDFMLLDLLLDKFVCWLVWYNF